MAGLGLTNAVRMFQDGADWKERKDQRASDKTRQDAANKREDDALALDERANQAARAALAPPDMPQQSMQAQPGTEMPAGQDGQPGLAMPEAQLPAGGAAAPAGPRKLGKADYLKAFDAQAGVYAEAGNVKKLMETEARAYPLRTEIRNEGLGNALNDLKADGDANRLAQSAYPLIRDGKEIRMAKTLPDGQLEFSMSDGTKQLTTPAKIAERVQYAMMNPQKVAEMELAARIEAAKAQAKADGEIKVERVKGDEHRKTEEVKGGNALGLATVNNAADLGRTKVSAGATLGAAGIGAAASRYGADQRLKGQEIAAEADVKAAGLRSTKQAAADKAMRGDVLQRLVVNSGIGVIDPVTQQTRGNADSNKVALRAQQYLDLNPEMSELEAVNRASGEFNARKGSK